MKFTTILASVLVTSLPLSASLANEPPMGSPPGIVPAVAMTDRPVEMIKLDASRQPVAVLKFLHLKRGDRVLDVMPGAGYYSEIIGNAIGSHGMVIAMEPPGFLDDKAKAGWAELSKRVPNAVLMPMAPADAALAPASFDFVLFHLTYHDLYWESAKYGVPRMDPAVFMAKIYAATRPGGLVGVVDHIGAAGVDPRVEVERSHRIDPAVILADFAAAGFVLEASSPLLAVASDDHSKLVFDPAVRGNTDRVTFRFRKPKA